MSSGWNDYAPGPSLHRRPRRVYPMYVWDSEEDGPGVERYLIVLSDHSWYGIGTLGPEALSCIQEEMPPQDYLDSECKKMMFKDLPEYIQTHVWNLCRRHEEMVV